MDKKTELERIKDLAYENPKPYKKTVSDILTDGAKTFSERNTTYGEAYKDVPKILGILFPNGVSNELISKPEFHLFHMVICKASRFAKADLKHCDSIHDLIVYAAMIESELTKRGE